MGMGMGMGAGAHSLALHCTALRARAARRAT